MKRIIWLLLAALGTVLLPVVPAKGMPMPEGSSCGRIIANSCSEAESLPCREQSARETPVCLPCCVTCCFAVLSTADTLYASLDLVARLDDLTNKGPSRSDPPPLPPPRLLG